MLFSNICSYAKIIHDQPTSIHSALFTKKFSVASTVISKKNLAIPFILMAGMLSETYVKDIVFVFEKSIQGKLVELKIKKSNMFTHSNKLKVLPHISKKLL